MFDLVKKIYNKDKITEEIEMFHVIYVLNCLSRDKDMWKGIKKCLPYIFKVKPKHFYQLLYYNTPKKYNVPYFGKKKEKKEIKIDDELLNIKRIFNWTDKEFNMMRRYL